jgi:predicted nucleic acid-binding protein
LFEFLVDSERGLAVAAYLEDARLYLPELAYYETAGTLRKAEQSKIVSSEVAEEALGFLLALETEVFSFHSIIERAWELRDSVTVYDAAYVAVAEAARCPLVTLDESLSHAPGPRCEFVVP